MSIGGITSVIDACSDATTSFNDIMTSPLLPTHSVSLASLWNSFRMAS